MKVSPELVPLIEWWEKDGKETVICCLIAALAVGGWYGWKNYKANVKAESSQALVSALTTEELESAASKYGNMTVGGAIKIRLAKNYFDNERYEDALAQYDQLIGNAPDGFADIPVVGRAQCLEALGRFEEAAKEFDKFAEENPKSYLKLTAQLGAARSIAQNGDKVKALARISALKQANKDDALATVSIEAVESVIERYEAPAAVEAPVVSEKEVE